MRVPRPIVLAIPLLVVIAALFFFVRYGYQSLNGKKEIAVIRQGICQQHIKHGTLYGLKGDVEFYWNRLYTPIDFQRQAPPKDGYLKIPGVWNGTLVKGKPIDGIGYATIRFWIKLPKGKLFGLKLQEFDCSYKLWIDGKPRIDCGKVGTTKESTIPSWKRNTQYFYSTNSTTEVVIQIANFHHWKGGPEDTMMLGCASDIMKNKEAALGFNFFTLGVFLIMGIAHLVVFVYLKKDLSSLVFSLFCLVIMIRLITTGEKIIYYFSPDLEWGILVQLEYLSYILAPSIFLFFIYLIYRQLIPKLICKICWGVAIFLSVAVLVLPSTLYTYIPLFHQVVIFIMGLYVQVVLSVALYRKYAYSIELFFSYTFFFIVTINDIFYYSKLLDTAYLIQLGVFVMIVAQAFVISKKNSLAFRDVEILKDRLQQNNKELEDTVEERTQAISFQKQEIEVQAAELLQANEQLHKVDRLKNALTATIVHDLKNPLNMILNFSDDIRITSAGQQMLSLVQNILDIQQYENDRMVLNRKRTTIGAILGRSFFSINYLANQKNVRIVNEIPGGIELDVDADVVERIFTNLLTNALKYAPMNSDVILHFEVDPDRGLVFSVEDSGPGIPMDKAELVFEKYGSYNEKMLGRVKPTGLGLTFCKMAVEAHGGEIGFNSITDGGTQMWFSMPLLDSNPLFESSEVQSSDHVEEGVDLVVPQFDNVVDRQHFLQAIDKLTALEVHQASLIRKVLNQHMPQDNSEVEIWKCLLLSSVWAGNERRYKEQLDITRKLIHSEG